MEIFLKHFAPDFKCYFPSNSSAPISREDEMAMAKMMMTAIPDMLGFYQQLGMELKPKTPAK
ncbi:MAG: hypothetical protein NT006_09895 [Candidatus Aminicenantes bacterium]|nr:hypothetical protein [Candidatus Aminicenantes bacterium]